MIKGEGNPDPLDLLPALRVRQSDGADDSSPPSSRYSSCGDSEFDRYCSANSVMGTPSMCSTITVFNDFPEFDFGPVKSLELGDDNGLENFSLGGKVEINHKDRRLLTSSVSPASMRDSRTGFCSENVRNQQNLKYGSSGLELYGDDSDDPAITMLDGSGLMRVNQFNNVLDQIDRNDVKGSVVCTGPNELRGVKDDADNLSSDGSDESDDAETAKRHLLEDVDGKCSRSYAVAGESGLSCSVSGKDDFNRFDTQYNLQDGEGEVEREENGNSSSCEHSDGEDSTYNYGNEENKNEFYMPRSILYRPESKVQHENPLLINTAVAFGSQDLDDFVLETEGKGQISQMINIFRHQRDKNPDVEENLINFGSRSSMGFKNADRTEKAKDKKDKVKVSEKVCKTKDLGKPEIIEAGDVSSAFCQVQGADNLTNMAEDSSTPSTGVPRIVNLQREDPREVYVAKNQVEDADKFGNCPEAFSVSKAGEIDLYPEAEARQHQSMNTKEAIVASDAQQVESLESENSKSNLNQPCNGTVSQTAKSFENPEQDVPSTNFRTINSLESSSTSQHLLEKTHPSTKVENFAINESIDEVVHEMEEILLVSNESPAAGLSQGNELIEPQLSMPLRNGGLTASTSSADDAYPKVQQPIRIDRIEVIGARQKQGNVSFSERLVGVKEYTVYKIRVWSGRDEWEVERRYRAFLTLYRQMKSLFTEQGWPLPFPWFSVEKESKKIFGSASPDVVVQRSILIQECLQSLLHTRFFSSPPRALTWFLSPQDSYPNSIALVSGSSFSTRAENSRNFSTFGKTISLVVEIQPHKSKQQILEAQRKTCAGCHKHFDDEKTLIWEFVETFGWGKPRLCEYTGQLFCSSCHTNDTTVLPARILHHWDFTPYPVSQLAKSYLDSIHDQPVLCVTAVNPLLLSKVPALLHIMNVRKKIGIMLPYVCRPFLRSIYRVLGSRKYLIENHDFFALRDLIDLSKGAFAALPVMVESLSRKILRHITDQCLVCCDKGVPCNARQDCRDPSSLIFPFQEDEIKRCLACQSVFHKRCFKKLVKCPCGANLRLNETTGKRARQRGSGETRGTLNLLGSGLSTRFLSGFFSKEKPENISEHKDNNVLLMDSLPTSHI